MYLNEIYFGQEGPVSINGIGEASRFFFDKSAADLSVSESAVLAGLIKAPNQFSPHRNLERCTARRNEVLEAMHKKRVAAGRITRGGKGPAGQTGALSRLPSAGPLFHGLSHRATDQPLQP